MAEDGSSGWESTLQDLVADNLCCGAAVGDTSSGYLYAHLFGPGLEEEIGLDFSDLYSGESYTAENLADDMVTKTSIDVCETAQVKSLCDNRDVPKNGVYIGKKKFNVIQCDDLYTKSYGDKLVKSYVLAIGKLNGCLSVEGAYYVLGVWDSQKKPDVRAACVEQVCDMAAYLGSA